MWAHVERRQNHRRWMLMLLLLHRSRMLIYKFWPTDYIIHRGQFGQLLKPSGSILIGGSLVILPQVAMPPHTMPGA
jgi:hypothetical protein